MKKLGGFLIGILMVVGDVMASPTSLFQPYEAFEPVRKVHESGGGLRVRGQDVLESSDFGSSYYDVRLNAQHVMGDFLVGVDGRREAKTFRVVDSGFSFDGARDVTTYAPFVSVQKSWLDGVVQFHQDSEAVTDGYWTYDVAVRPVPQIEVGQFRKDSPQVWRVDIETDVESDSFLTDYWVHHEGLYYTLRPTDETFVRYVNRRANLDPIRERDVATITMDFPSYGQELQAGFQYKGMAVEGYVQDHFSVGQMTIVDGDDDELGDLEGRTFHNAKGVQVSREIKSWVMTFKYDFREVVLYDSDLSLQAGDEGFSSLLGKYYTTEGLRSKSHHYTVEFEKDDWWWQVGYSMAEYSGHYEDYDRIVFLNFNQTIGVDVKRIHYLRLGVKKRFDWISKAFPVELGFYQVVPLGSEK